jgi:phospholipid-binding lipoprotein MlaA
MTGSLRRCSWALGLLAVVALSACSTLGAKSEGQKLDPWEGWNRKVFSFNEGLDTTVLKPAATAYSKFVPQLVRQGIGNFFGNAADAWSFVNNILQGRVEAGGKDLIRFGTNTVFGLGGVIDVASEMGLYHQYEDFGQTLGRWGVGAGAYIVWPLLGPSTVRESFALPFDRAVSPALVINNGAWQFGLAGLQIINTRADLLGASRVLDDIALDKYTFVRDAYLQRRRSLISDGDEPGLPDESKPEAAPPTPPPTAQPAKK